MIEPSMPLFHRSAPVPHVSEEVGYATLFLDKEQRITAGSSTADRFFRLAVTHMIGLPVTNFLPGLRGKAEEDPYTAGQRARVSLSRVELIARRGDGSEVPVTVSLIETREAASPRGVLQIREWHGD